MSSSARPAHFHSRKRQFWPGKIEPGTNNARGLGCNNVCKFKTTKQN